MRYAIIGVCALLAGLAGAEPCASQRIVLRPRVAPRIPAPTPRPYRFDPPAPVQARPRRTDIEVPDTIQDWLSYRLSGQHNRPQVRRDQIYGVAKALNLRAGPSTHDRVIRVLRPGSVVILGDRSSIEWAPVVDWRGQRIGYVYTAGDHLSGSASARRDPPWRTGTRDEIRRVSRRNTGAVGP